MTDPQQKVIALLDIDGCIVDPTERLALYESDFRRYVNSMHLDTPIPQGIKVYSALMASPDIRGTFITSRGESQRRQTQAQLQSLFGHTNFDLWMRRNGDTRDCPDVKFDLLMDSGHTPRDVFIAFDDRQSVIEMYRGLGIVAYQTAVGW